MHFDVAISEITVMYYICHITGSHSFSTRHKPKKQRAKGIDWTTYGFCRGQILALS